MRIRKNWAVSAMALLLVLVVLAGCAGAAPAHDCDVAVSLDDALAAQDKAMAGLMMGSVELTNAEFSSLVTELIKQNAAGVPIEMVAACFTEDGMDLDISFTDGTSLHTSGNIAVADNQVVVDLASAGMNGMAVAEGFLPVVEGAINRALGDASLGVAVDVSTGDGTLAVSLGQ